MKPFKQSLIYVFSGTGNTSKIARTTHDYFSSNQVESRLIHVNDTTNGEPDVTGDTLVSFMFPSHGFMPPWSMIKFLLKYPKGNKSNALCVSTRGAIKAGPLTVPGVAGLATFFASIVLFLKGFKIRGLFSIDMPSNFINFHWGLNQNNVRKISDKGEAKTKAFLEKLIQGGTVFFTLNNFWEISWSILLLYVFPIFPVLYILIARLAMGKIMFANGQCNSCGLCAKNCPSGAILMKGQEKKHLPYWTDKCDVCMRCMGSCPQKAIEASHTWFILLILVTTIPVAGFLAEHLLNTTVLSENVIDYLNYLYAYPAILIMYKLFFFITKNRQVKSIVTYLTLTHYYRRFFHPDVKVKDLRP